MYSTQSSPLTDEYPERIAEASNAGGNRIHRLRPGAFPRSSGFKNTQVASDRPSITRRIIRGLGRFSAAVLIGVGATLAWQSYGGEMVRAWAPSLGWLLPVSPSAELQAQLKPVALDLAIMRRSVEQLAGNQDQLARKQDLCVPKTLSVLIGGGNHLTSAHNDRAAMLCPKRLGLAI